MTGVVEGYTCMNKLSRTKWKGPKPAYLKDILYVPKIATKEFAGFSAPLLQLWKKLWI